MGGAIVKIDCKCGRIFELGFVEGDDLEKRFDCPHCKRKHRLSVNQKHGIWNVWKGQERQMSKLTKPRKLPRHSLKKVVEDLTDFHNTFGHPVVGKPSIPPDKRKALRIRLIEEEVGELIKGLKEDDLVEIADGIADAIYVIVGTGLEYGIPQIEVFDEVQRSNMSKVGEDGKSINDEGGKTLKGPNYFKPDIEAILAEAEDAADIYDCNVGHIEKPAENEEG